MKNAKHYLNFSLAVFVVVGLVVVHSLTANGEETAHISSDAQPTISQEHQSSDSHSSDEKEHTQEHIESDTTSQSHDTVIESHDSASSDDDNDCIFDGGKDDINCVTPTHEEPTPTPQPHEPTPTVTPTNTPVPTEVPTAAPTSTPIVVNQSVTQNNNQTVNVTNNNNNTNTQSNNQSQSQTQQVLGTTTVQAAPQTTKLPSTGPSDLLYGLIALIPAGIKLRKIA